MNLPGFTEDLRPKFYSDNFFRVTIYNVNYNDSGGEDGVINVVTTAVTKKDLLNKIVEVIIDDGNITIAEIAAKLGIHKRTADRYITELKRQNKISRVGSNKAGHWIVKSGE